MFIHSQFFVYSFVNVPIKFSYGALRFAVAYSTRKLALIRKLSVLVPWKRLDIDIAIFLKIDRNRSNHAVTQS